MRSWYGNLKAVTEWRVALNTLWKEDNIIAYDKKLTEFERKSVADIRKGHLCAKKADEMAKGIDAMEFDLAALGADRNPRDIIKETCEKLGAINKVYPFGDWQQDAIDVEENLRQLVGMARNGQGYHKRENELMRADADILMLRNNNEMPCSDIKRIQDELGQIMFGDKPTFNQKALRETIEAVYGHKGDSDVADKIREQIMIDAKFRFSLMRQQSLARFKLGHDRIILNFMAGNIKARAAKMGLELIAAERKLNKVVRDIIVMCANPKVDEEKLEMMDKRLNWVKKECDKCLKRMGRAVSAKMNDYLFNDRAEGAVEKLREATEGISVMERNMNIYNAQKVGKEAIQESVHKYRTKLATQLGKIR